MTLDLLAKTKEELSNDDDWIVGQAKLLEQQHKIYETNLMIKALEEFNDNIEKIKNVFIILIIPNFELKKNVLYFRRLNLKNPKFKVCWKLMFQIKKTILQ